MRLSIVGKTSFHNVHVHASCRNFALVRWWWWDKLIFAQSSAICVRACISSRTRARTNVHHVLHVYASCCQHHPQRRGHDGVLSCWREPVVAALRKYFVGYAGVFRIVLQRHGYCSRCHCQFLCVVFEMRALGCSPLGRALKGSSFKKDISSGAEMCDNVRLLCVIDIRFLYLRIPKLNSIPFTNTHIFI